LPKKRKNDEKTGPEPKGSEQGGGGRNVVGGKNRKTKNGNAIGKKKGENAGVPDNAYLGGKNSLKASRNQ